MVKVFTVFIIIFVLAPRLCESSSPRNPYVVWNVQQNKVVKTPVSPAKELHKVLSADFLNEVDTCMKLFTNDGWRSEHSNKIKKYKCPQTYCLEAFDVTADYLNENKYLFNLMVTNTSVEKLLDELDRLELKIKEKRSVLLYTNESSEITIEITPPNSSDTPPYTPMPDLNTNTEKKAYERSFNIKENFRFDFVDDDNGEKHLIAAFSVKRRKCDDCHHSTNRPKYCGCIKTNFKMPEEEYKYFKGLRLLDGENISYKNKLLTVKGLYPVEYRNKARNMLNLKKGHKIETIYNDVLVHVLQEFKIAIPSQDHLAYEAIILKKNIN